MQLEGQPSPVVEPQGKYPKAISQLLEGYKRDDPAPEPKLAVPVTVPNHLAHHSGTTPLRQAIGDLALIAFYFLLRVGEYTYHKESDRRRTQQFRVDDVTMWHGNTRLSHKASTPYLYKKCTSITLSISNQKNGKRNQTIHQESLHTKNCPNRAVIRRVKHIQAHTTNTDEIIGTYFANKSAPGKQVTPDQMNKAVKRAVTDLRLDINGLHATHVGSHSLRAGGAMAMHLNGIDPNTIKKMGRWSSDTFLMYIHEQIAAFSNNVSKRMSNPITFHNIACQPAQNQPPNVVHHPFAGPQLLDYNYNTR